MGDFGQARTSLPCLPPLGPSSKVSWGGLSPPKCLCSAQPNGPPPELSCDPIPTPGTASPLRIKSSSTAATLPDNARQVPQVRLRPWLSSPAIALSSPWLPAPQRHPAAEGDETLNSQSKAHAPTATPGGDTGLPRSACLGACPGRATRCSANSQCRLVFLVSGVGG